MVVTDVTDVIAVIAVITAMVKMAVMVEMVVLAAPVLPEPGGSLDTLIFRRKHRKNLVLRRPISPGGMSSSQVCHNVRNRQRSLSSQSKREFPGP